MLIKPTSLAVIPYTPPMTLEELANPVLTASTHKTGSLKNTEKEFSILGPLLLVLAIRAQEVGVPKVRLLGSTFQLKSLLTPTKDFYRNFARSLLSPFDRRVQDYFKTLYGTVGIGDIRMMSNELSSYSLALSYNYQVNEFSVNNSYRVPKEKIEKILSNGFYRAHRPEVLEKMNPLGLRVIKLRDVIFQAPERMLFAPFFPALVEPNLCQPNLGKFLEHVRPLSIFCTPDHSEYFLGLQALNLISPPHEEADWADHLGEVFENLANLFIQRYSIEGILSEEIVEFKVRDLI